MVNTFLTETQLQIVHSPLERLMVEAQPGSGKTRILVEKLVRAFSYVGADQVVAITFTEKAAQEIKDRVSKALPNLFLDAAWISTIHGFCSRILVEKAPFQILSAEQSFFLKNKAIQESLEELILAKDGSLYVVLSEYGFTKTRSLLDHLLDRNTEKVSGTFMPADLKSGFIWGHLCKVMDHCFQRYSEKKKQRSSLDFDDLLIRCLDLLKQDPALLKKYRSHFKWFFVDEFQDTNHHQAELVRLLTDGPHPHPALMVVGDPKQSIYRFRGADVDLFYNVKKDILEKNGFCFELLENFRSHKTLTEFVNTLFKPLLGSQFLASIPQSQCTEPSTIQYWRRTAFSPEKGCLDDKDLSSLESRHLEAEWCASHIKKFGKKVDWSQIAILFRAMTYAHLYEEALTAKGVPWIRTDLGNLFEHPQVQSLISSLRWALNPQDDMALWTLLSSPEFQWSSERLLALAQMRLQNKTSLVECFERYAQKYDQTVWLRLMRLKYLVNRVTLEGWFQLWDFSPTREVRSLIRIAKDFETQNPDMEWKEFLIYCDALNKHQVNLALDPTEISEEGVRILTVHQSKGLEFEAVYLPDLSYTPRREYPFVLIDSCFKIGIKTFEKPNQWVEDESYSTIKEEEKMRDTAESKRLLYVAMTRAKKHLILSHSSSKPRSQSWAYWIDEYYPDIQPYLTEGEF